jgi:hypothetical protein
MTTPAPTITADTVRHLDPAIYERDRAAMVDALLASGAQSVFEIGSVGAPGISDLDLIACFADDASLRGPWDAVQRLLPGSQTFLHAPCALRARHLRLLPSLFAVRQMRAGDGTAVEVAAQTPVQRLLWNVEACAAVLATLQTRRQITTRSALCLLNGVRYNVDLARLDRIEGTSAERFGERITALRRNWFSLAADVRTHELASLWGLAQTTLRELLAGYANRVRARLLDEPAELLMRVPGAKTTYWFSDRGAPRLLLTQPLGSVLALPQALGALFQLLAAPGLGLDQWLTVDRVEEGDDARIDPEFAHAAHDYARDNARYLDDMLATRTPFVLLGAGTLVSVRSTAADRVMNLLRRVKAKLLPARG